MGLKDKAHRLVSISGGFAQIHCREFLASHSYLAAGWLVELSNQVEQAAFARTRRTDDGHGRPLFPPLVELGKHLNRFSSFRATG